MAAANDPDAYALTASEAGRLLYVGPKTVARWAQEGRLPHKQTPGGHRRFRPSDILAFAEAAEANRDRQRQQTQERFRSRSPSSPTADAKGKGVRGRGSS